MQVLGMALEHAGAPLNLESKNEYMKHKMEERALAPNSIQNGGEQVGRACHFTTGLSSWQSPFLWPYCFLYNVKKLNCLCVLFTWLPVMQPYHLWR